MGKRNNSQRKENVESPRKEISETEACNMTEKEFRVMVVEFIHRMDEKINNLCKNQEEMKSDIATIKNTMESFNSRLQEAEDRIKNNSETMWIPATERNRQDYSSHEDRREAVQRWKTLTWPSHTSSCPGPNQRELDLHYHHLSTIQNCNGQLDPPWRRNLGSPRYVISAGALPAGEGIPRQVLGMEATGA
ncbi:hypothetical protein QTO34_000478 [Cnephaeus nilssonii]|uniref:Uncharacterized protein n=1 Tax=Cnephaeus nilssonii TaxID=3371016 RepID=A0AA40LWX9_CNENI|nr:hypothetical protein QTO34_000478 [Eptesicus nilssonii]